MSDYSWCASQIPATALVNVLCAAWRMAASPPYLVDHESDPRLADDLHVREGLTTTNTNYPFISYGTDWLAFAHLVIAVAFIGPWRDPVRNIWVIEWGMICCVGIVPLALIAGPIRHLPWWWLPIDISFGVFGIIPLIIVHRMIKRLEYAPTAHSPVAGRHAVEDHA